MSGCVGALPSFGPQTHTHTCSGFLFGEMKKGEFTGVWIPKEIWEHPVLTWMQKCVVAEIMCLSLDGPCFASNRYLGEKFGVTEKRMKNIITDMRKKGLIEDVGRRGNSRHIRVVENIPTGPGKRDQIGPEMWDSTGPGKRAPEIIGEKTVEKILKKNTNSILSDTEKLSALKAKNTKDISLRTNPLSPPTPSFPFPKFLAAMRDRGVTAPDDFIREMIDSGKIEVVCKFGKFPGADGLAKVIEASHTYGYDPAKHPARSQRDSQVAAQV